MQVLNSRSTYFCIFSLQHNDWARTKVLAGGTQSLSPTRKSIRICLNQARCHAIDIGPPPPGFGEGITLKYMAACAYGPQPLFSVGHHHKHLPIAGLRPQFLFVEASP